MAHRILTPAETAALSRPCPTCYSAPGEACTAPNPTGRRHVDWVHLSREIAPEPEYSARCSECYRPIGTGHKMDCSNS